MKSLKRQSLIVAREEQGPTKNKREVCVWYGGARGKERVRYGWFIWRRWCIVVSLSGGGVALRLGDRVKVKRY